MPKVDSYAPGQFCWVDLVAHDMLAAGGFYAQLFDWQIETQDTQGGPPYSVFTLDGEPVAGLGQMNEAMKEQGIPPMWNSYVKVGDVDAAAELVAEHGGSITVPPMDLPNEAGRLAFLADPSGANLGLLQPGTHRGAARVNETGAFCWNELATRELDRAAEFFGGLFGWQTRDNPDSPARYLIATNEGRRNAGLMEMTEEWGDLPPHWTVYFAVEDVDATAKKVQELGGKLHFGPFPTPAGPMAVVADPQGAHFHVIALDPDVVD